MKFFLLFKVTAFSSKMLQHPTIKCGFGFDINDVNPKKLIIRKKTKGLMFLFFILDIAHTFMPQILKNILLIQPNHDKAFVALTFW
jgi:hypothetical protein